MTTHASSPDSFTVVHILRTSAFPENHISPFERTVDDAAKVQALYEALVALPAYPHRHWVGTPISWGVYYHLTFFRDGTPSLRVVVQPDGVKKVSLGEADTRWAIDGERLWVQLADTCDVPLSLIYPVLPQSTGPSAPTGVPE